jgi:uncharacterized protein with PQ loop repeat
MPPNPMTPASQTPLSDRPMSRLLGSMSIFTMLVTLPQVLTIWIGHQAAGVSLLSWSAYLLTAIFWFCHGVRTHDKNIYLACVVPKSTRASSLAVRDDFYGLPATGTVVKAAGGARGDRRSPSKPILRLFCQEARTASELPAINSHRSAGWGGRGDSNPQQPESQCVRSLATP